MPSYYLGTVLLRARITWRFGGTQILTQQGWRPGAPPGSLLPLGGPENALGCQCQAPESHLC